MTKIPSCIFRNGSETPSCKSATVWRLVAHCSGLQMLDQISRLHTQKAVTDMCSTKQGKSLIDEGFLLVYLSLPSCPGTPFLSFLHDHGLEIFLVWLKAKGKSCILIFYSMDSRIPSPYSLDLSLVHITFSLDNSRLLILLKMFWL